MSEQKLTPGWIQDAYYRLWSCSEDFTAERHGLTVLRSPPSSPLSCFGQRVIAVRDEYLQVWDYIKDAHDGKHHGGLVLTGHTGTGTYYLRWAILGRLPRTSLTASA